MQGRPVQEQFVAQNPGPGSSDQTQQDVWTEQLVSIVYCIVKEWQWSAFKCSAHEESRLAGQQQAPAFGNQSQAFAFTGSGGMQQPGSGMTLGQSADPTILAQRKKVKAKRVGKK